jgi:hypothetical protein
MVARPFRNANFINLILRQRPFRHQAITVVSGSLYGVVNLYESSLIQKTYLLIKVCFYLPIFYERVAGGARAA